MKREYERKYKLNKPLNIVKVLNEIHQKDVYYTHPNLGEKEYLRVREKDGKRRLEYHRVISDDITEEHEIAVDGDIEKVLEILGAKPKIVVEKIRKEVLIYKKGEYIRVFIDEVKGLGTFIEIEGYDEEYLDWAERVLGLSDPIRKGYPDLMEENASR